MIGDQFGDVEAAANRAVLILLGQIERKLLLPNNAPHPVEVAVPVDIVDLQELSDVRFADVPGLDHDGPQVDDLDRNRETLGGWQNNGVIGKSNLRFERLEVNFRVDGLGKLKTKEATEFLGDRDRLGITPPTGGMNAQDVAIGDGTDARGLPGKFDQVREVLIGFNRIGEANLDVRIVALNRLDLQDAKITHGGHGDGVDTTLGRTNRRAIPRQDDGRGVRLPHDPQHVEGVEAQVGLMLPGNIEPLRILSGGEHRFHIFIVGHICGEQMTGEDLLGRMLCDRRQAIEIDVDRLLQGGELEDEHSGGTRDRAEIQPSAEMLP